MAREWLTPEGELLTEHDVQIRACVKFIDNNGMSDEWRRGVLDSVRRMFKKAPKERARCEQAVTDHIAAMT